MIKKIQGELIGKIKRVCHGVLYTFIGYIISISLTFADGGILGNFIEGDDEKGSKTAKALREGDIHMKDIPNILKGAIDFFMGIAGTIAIIFIIIGAYQILFGSLEQDKTKGKNTIFMALGGFAIASLAWIIIKFVIDNLSSSEIAYNLIIII